VTGDRRQQKKALSPTNEQHYSEAVFVVRAPLSRAAPLLHFDAPSSSSLIEMHAAKQGTLKTVGSSNSTALRA